MNISSFAKSGAISLDNHQVSLHAKVLANPVISSGVKLEKVIFFFLPYMVMLAIFGSLDQFLVCLKAHVSSFHIMCTLSIRFEKHGQKCCEREKTSILVFRGSCVLSSFPQKIELSRQEGQILHLMGKQLPRSKTTSNCCTGHSLYSPRAVEKSAVLCLVFG